MSNCNITQPFTGDANSLYQVVKTQIEQKGGTITGDATAGNFDIPALGSSIVGTYTIQGQNMILVITKKPFGVSCNQIEKYVADHFHTLKLR
jgi:hypothetical protein